MILRNRNPIAGAGGGRPVRRTRVALIAGGVLIGALLVELALRTVYTIPEVADPLYSCHQSDSVLGWRGRRDLRMRFRRPDFDVLVEHGRDGWRRPDPPPPANPVRRILVLGDSFTWGWGVDQGDVFSDHLQRRLPAGVAVYNRGVNGYGTGQEYLLLQQELAARSYDVVVLLFFGNDVADNVNPKRGRRPLFALEGPALVPPNRPPQPLMSPLQRFFKDHSRAYQLADVAVDAMRRWLRDEDHAPPVDPSDVAFSQLPGRAVTMRLLAEMRRLATAHGAQFVLVYVPDAGEVEPGRAGDPSRRAVHAMIHAVAARDAIPLIDLTDAFAAQARRGRVLIFPHDDHWTPAGHALAAQTLLESPVINPP
jgi:lysophospholipase L1-like esterase